MLFWEDEPVRERGGRKKETYNPPAIPDTGWELPEGNDAFPSLQGRGLISIDIETNDPELKAKGPGVMRDGYICGVAVGTSDGWRQYYPIAHEKGPNLPSQYVFEWLDQELRSNVPKVGAKIIYDLTYLKAAGVTINGPFYDVQIAEGLLDENRLQYSLDSISRDRLGEGKKQDLMLEWLEAAFGKGNIKGNIWRAPPAVVGPYAESDVDLPLRLLEVYRPLLEQENLWELFELESRMIPLLRDMHLRGVPVDVKEAEKLSATMQHDEKALLAGLKHDTGMDIDIWSADSLSRLFDHKGLDYPLTEKTKKPSFKRGWLEHHKDPVAQQIVEIRALNKFRGTFIDGYIIGGHNNGKIHCEFHQLKGEGGGASTGRLSSSNPNLQNIPIRDPKYGPLIRGMFTAENDQDWWKLDWSQIEYRLIVHFADRMGFKGAAEAAEAYRTNPATDYHQMVADMVKTSRANAKTINFGLAYGMGIALLAFQLSVSLDEAADLLQRYHAGAPFIKLLTNRASNTAARNGIVKTLLGRRRRFVMWEKKGVVSPVHTPGSRRAFTNKALNAAIQGSAADIMKKAMVEIFESGVTGILGVPHLTVHDELDGSCPRTKAGREAVREVKNIMENCVDLNVPLLADGGYGSTWANVGKELS